MSRMEAKTEEARVDRELKDFLEKLEARMDARMDGRFAQMDDHARRPVLPALKPA